MIVQRAEKLNFILSRTFYTHLSALQRRNLLIELRPSLSQKVIQFPVANAGELTHRVRRDFVAATHGAAAKAKQKQDALLFAQAGEMRRREVWIRRRFSNATVHAAGMHRYNVARETPTRCAIWAAPILGFAHARASD